MTDSGAEVRSQLDHPVIDTEINALEFVPALARVLRRAGIDEQDVPRIFAGSRPGVETWAALSPRLRAERRVARPGWWRHPGRDVLDLASVQFPRLLYERLDEIGVDLCVLYPTLGLAFSELRDDELRRRCCRIVNQYHAELYAKYADRFVPVAVVPMFDPDEAVEEVEHAVTELGFKTVVISGSVPRTTTAVEGSGSDSANERTWMDFYSLDSLHDYDPFWRRCVELRVSIGVHAKCIGWGSRRSISSYVYNHIGHTATANEALCKSLFLGGVTRRFPDLRFAFLGGGVGWAQALYADLLDHWQKRNGEAIRQCDPALVDRARFSELFDLYGARDYGDHLIFTAGDMSPKQSPWRMLYEWSPDQHDRALGIDGFDSDLLDEFAKPRITRAEDMRDLFVTNFWFRSSTRDPFLRTAVAESTDPLGAPLNVMLGSGAGSWQAPDISAFLVEAHAAMESGRLTAREFHQTAFGNAARFYTDTNPQFFRGTVIERDVEELLRADARLRSMGPSSQRHAGRRQ